MRIKEILLALFLSIIVLIVIVDYVYLQHKTRNKFIELQALVGEEHKLSSEWGKLQLERSTLVNNSSIEKKAKQQLNMKLPNKESIISIKR